LCEEEDDRHENAQGAISAYTKAQQVGAISSYTKAQQVGPSQPTPRHNKSLMNYVAPDKVNVFDLHLL